MNIINIHTAIGWKHATQTSPVRIGGNVVVCVLFSIFRLILSTSFDDPNFFSVEDLILYNDVVASGDQFVSEVGDTGLKNWTAMDAFRILTVVNVLFLGTTEEDAANMDRYMSELLEQEKSFL